MMRYLEVVVENKSKHTDNFFTYRTDDPTITIGDKVWIPFGKGNHRREGFVFGTTSTIECPEERIKFIGGKVEEGSLNEEMIKTIIWMKQRYAITFYDGIRCFTVHGKAAREGKEREPYKELVGTPDRGLRILTEEQQNAMQKINSAFFDQRHEIFLLHGVTASGKTQVYMEAIKTCLSLGKSAVMLVPEISLTKQVIEVFVDYFGKEKIAVLHSKLTPRERYDEWQRIRSGRAKIVIGARMAVFAPVENLGLMIMDEEHESTYKSDMNPKYDTVDVAAKRMLTSEGILLLGSATPSVVSYQRAKDGIYNLIELKHRYNQVPLPKVDIVDMRQELQEGNTSIFSRRLYHEIDTCLKSGQQVILFQNRRGYANFLSCRKCGSVMKCPECQISLVYHKTDQAMVCHYCGKRSPIPTDCPECHSKYIKYFGIGTEQVEEATNEFFPEEKIGRLDLDSIKNRKELERILNDFSKGKTRILIGTQLVAKGLDFHNVGLVGVIAGDTSLNLPDYRAAERTFQLITQVAGRAGRGDKQGLVIVQTYEPKNYAFQRAKDHDYQGFFQEESQLRRYMEYPPFGDIMMVNFTSEREEDALETAQACKNFLQNAIGKQEESRVLSPKFASGFKGKNSYREYILVKCPRGQRNQYMFYLKHFMDECLEAKSKVHINVDVNPYSIF